jgi:hypothetical protein
MSWQLEMIIDRYTDDLIVDIVKYKSDHDYTQGQSKITAI